MEKAALKRWGIIIGCVALAACAACTFLAWETRDAWLPRYVELRTSAEAWLKHVSPVVFFSLMAVVPVVPVPMSPFYLATGIFPTPVALLGILVALPVNFAITYWLAVTFMRPLAEKLLARAGLKIPRPSTRRNGILFSIFIRVCGTPYTLQNYIIPLAGVSFRDYMLYGLPFQYIPAIAMMLVGDSLLRGNMRKALVGIAVLVALAIATKLTKDWMQKRKAAQTGVTETAADAKAGE